MRPRVIVNVAMSADGKLSTRERQQVKISGSEDFARVDALKAASDAVMVGIGTVIADDPSLTVKSEANRQARIAAGRPEHPVRVIVDSTARIPLDASVLRKGSGQRVVAVSEKADPGRVAELKKTVTVVVAGKDSVDLRTLLEQLGSMGIRQLMVEGGGTLIAGLFSASLVDELYTFIGNIVIGGRDAPTLVDGDGWIRDSEFARLILSDFVRIEDGILLHWYVGQGQSSGTTGR
ncbi:MAG: 2,5-diamino-6-ribosylamino-4(3H)-pyrimidinone 5'-phosphate reductase [Methanoregula sp. PtaU1.Bin051]|nr:MAG: 2,5-diamino-6-ribosylamino-4(3H)-pyrimidinone 5'-phosphate reductase [Methanoregula sp. PtaU1.Bin051]